MPLRIEFPIAYNAPKDMPRLRFIHPQKQAAVASLIEHTKKNFPSVERLIIFGSVVTQRCHQYSDVDVVVVGCQEFYSCDCDVFDITRVEGMDPNSSFVQRIVKEGVIVYDKDYTT